MLAALSASLALAEDFKTINGKEYKDATIRRVEADGIVVKTKSGISKVYFTELPKEVQKRFHYEAPKAVVPDVEQAAPVTDKTPRAKQPTAAETPAESETPRQLDDAQFDDLRRRDWYEDLKEQEKLKNHADWVVSLIDRTEKDQSAFEKCTPTFFEMLAAERKAQRENYRELSAIAAEISKTKSFNDYTKLKAIENQIRFEIEVQKIKDANDVEQLRLRVNERDAELLKIEQQRFQ